MESKIIPVEKVDKVNLENEILYKSKLFSTSNYYTGNDLGLTYSPEKSTFKLWAPTAKLVHYIYIQNLILIPIFKKIHPIVKLECLNKMLKLQK
jgi:hypothetical protein